MKQNPISAKLVKLCNKFLRILKNQEFMTLLDGLHEGTSLKLL